ncbi:DUF2924 domain-containing protein [Ostreiculturibacter nitratireducens]|uniref:DUF2924 domain-containing protein n=1 Tax=Ostreiculturibacter nitratireducens TaxID=3075226 RepID=UPI0031B56B2A
MTTPPKTARKTRSVRLPGLPAKPRGTGSVMEVADIEAMDREALLAAWMEIIGSPVPKGLSRPFLRRFLAFELQARRHGGLPSGFGAKLRKAASGETRPKAPALRPGGRLVREWNGTTHVVEVTGTGFVWQGTQYRSLSAIARAITGARWSGPRFFGLAGERSP